MANAYGRFNILVRNGGFEPHALASASPSSTGRGRSHPIRPVFIGRVQRAQSYNVTLATTRFAQIRTRRPATLRGGSAIRSLRPTAGVATIEGEASGCYNDSMVVASGKVVRGRVELDSELPEGTSVTVLVPEGDETFEANPETERMLLHAIAQCERGETIPMRQLLDELRDRE
jgi:hypothetical protein